VAAVVVGALHESGRLRLAVRQSAAHRRATLRRALLFYAGLLLLALVASGPVGRWSMTWFSVHMAGHVVEMFFVPALLVVGAPWVPLVHALPVDRRRRLLRRAYLGRRRSAWRGLRWLLTRPATAVVLFNGTMILWHIPRVYNWASWRGWPMDWCMVPLFVLSGYLFWRVVLPSHPWPPRGSTKQQVGAVVVTAFVMLVTALALAVFSRTAVYTMHVAMTGPARALRDQRLGAGILWVCGDFWAIPALVLVAYRVFGRGDGPAGPAPGAG
jgi:cytochrome c oxidase assembly factor CtaG